MIELYGFEQQNEQVLLIEKTSKIINIMVEKQKDMRLVLYILIVKVIYGFDEKEND
jgi:hypothetical protein